MSIDDPCASRSPPAKVDAVTIDGIRYAQRVGNESVDGQIGGILAAYDGVGKLLWTIKVYDNRRCPELEGDVQDIYFSTMTLEPDGRLRIVNESGETFLVDVTTRGVTAIPAVRSSDGGGLEP